MGRPTNGPWPGIYDYYWDTTVPLALFLWALSIGLVIFFETTSHLFSSYHRSKLKKRSFAGLLGILSWWWLAAVSLRFTNALIGFLLPDLSEVTLFQTLSFSTMGVLGIAFSMATDFTLFVLITLIYFVRHIALYLYVLLMPILIVLWIPGVGPFGTVAKFMERLGRFYVPFLVMAVPVAMLFRLGELLGSAFQLSWSGIGAWLSALVVPFVALLSPLVLFWQAGALFFMADRAASHVSTARAKDRLETARRAGAAGRLATRNFRRGLHGARAVRESGQLVFDSGGSRAHVAGSVVHSAGGRLTSTLRSNGGATGSGAGSGGDDSAGRSSHSGDGDDDGDGGESHQEEFDTLRQPRDESGDGTDVTQNRTESVPDGDDDTDSEQDDDVPRYIQ